MDEEIDWSLTTHAGNRRRQLAESYALPFRARVAALERSAAVAAFFDSRRAARGLPTRPAHPSDLPMDARPGAPDALPGR